MKLFSKEIDKKLFSQYSKGSDLDNQVVVTKIFNPYGNGRWFLLNSDPQEPDYLWAIVQMGDVVEMGSVLRSELESVRVSPFRFPLERDLSFRMVNAGELFRGLQEGKFYKKGGFVNGYAKGGIVYLESVGTYLRTSDMSTSPMQDFKNEGEINYVYENSDEWWDSLSQKDKKTIEEYKKENTKKSFSDGGETDEGVDLFEDYENIPQNVQNVLDKYSDAFDDGSYKGLSIAKKELEKIGYTFEYGLGGGAYDLRQIGEKGKNEDEYAKGGELNLGIRKIAEQEGFTPKQLGKDYELVMAQAIVESLTDANYHDAARKLVSLLEKNPKIAIKPNYPSVKDPKFKQKMAEIEKEYGSKYWEADDKTRNFAIKVSQKSGWDGYAIASAFEYLVRIDGGYHKLADKIEKAMESNEEMAKGGGIYTTDSLYYLQVIKDDKEVAREKFRAKSLKEAKEIAEEEYESKYISKYGNPLNFIVSEAMEEGGKTLESIRKEIDERNMKIRFKIALVIGLDKALKYLDMDYVISPFKLIEASVSKGFITIDEIDENIWRAARIEADEINDYYRGSGEGIGSSDINAFVSNMLNEAGIKVSVVDGRYTRMAEGGFISYANGDYENKLGNFKTLESAKKFAKANKSKYESITFEDEFGDNIVVSNEDSFKDIDWLFSNEMAEGGEVVEYKTIASFDDSSIIIYDGNLGYSDILKLTNKLPKKLKIIQVVLKDSNSLNALTEWSKKQVKKTFNSDFEEGFPIIYSIKEKGEINIQKAYGELKNGKKVIFDVDGLTWEEGEIELKDGGKLIGNQKKLDVNKNGKLDAQDFKMLRGKMAMGGETKKENVLISNILNEAESKFDSGQGESYVWDYIYKSVPLEIKGRDKRMEFADRLYNIVAKRVGKPVMKSDKMAKGGKVKKDFKVGDKVIYAPNGKWFVRNNLRNFKKGEITNVEVISGTKNYTVQFKNQYGEIINTLETYNTKELELDPDIEMAMGGETKFKDKVQSIKDSLLKRKKVSPSVQKDYGKTYSPKEAKESAQRIAGSMVSKMKEKVAKSNKK